MEVFILKDRVNGNRDNIFMMLFEKAFILISLLVVLLIGVAIGLPAWGVGALVGGCLLYTSPSPRDATLSRMPSSA